MIKTKLKLLHLLVTIIKLYFYIIFVPQCMIISVATLILFVIMLSLFLSWFPASVIFLLSPRVYGNQPLYPAKVEVRSVYIPLSPDSIVGLHWVFCCVKIYLTRNIGKVPSNIRNEKTKVCIIPKSRCKVAENAPKKVAQYSWNRPPKKETSPQMWVHVKSFFPQFMFNLTTTI